MFESVPVVNVFTLFMIVLLLFDCHSERSEESCHLVCYRRSDSGILRHFVPQDDRLFLTVILSVAKNLVTLSVTGVPISGSFVTSFLRMTGFF